MAQRYQAALLDLDGLVLDSESGYRKAWQGAAAAMGFYLSDGFCDGLSGLQGSRVRQRLIDHCGPALDWDCFAALSRQQWLDTVAQDGIAVKPGLHALLACLQQQGIPYSIATNSRRADALFCLEVSGLSGVFEQVVSRDDVANPKPAPDVFCQAAQRLAVAITACLVVEDSVVGVQAACAAGAACAYVPSTPQPDAWAVQQAVVVCNDLSEVAAYWAAGV